MITLRSMTVLALSGLLLACGGGASTAPGSGTVDAGTSFGGTDGWSGGFRTNPLLCSKDKGFQSAIRAASAGDPALMTAYAAALADAGYTAKTHGLAQPAADASEGADSQEPDVLADDAAPAPDGGFGAGEEDASGEAPPDDAGGAAEDVPDPDTQEPGDAEDPTDAADAGKDTGLPVEPTPVVVGWPTYAVGVDPLNDAVFLTPDGDLVVASYCPLDRLGQVRRLDRALLHAVEILAEVQGKTDAQAITARWARPTAWYGDRAGIYWRQYLPDVPDLNKPQQGALSVGAPPAGLALGLYGHARKPTEAGEIVTVEKLTVAKKDVVVQDKHTITAEAMLAWDLLAHATPGELAWKLDLLVADIGLQFKVGTYHVFFETLFPPGQNGALTLAVQGGVPGLLRVSKVITELDLPKL